MKILVTGASGFIGSHVVKSLIDSGHTVVGLVLPGDDLWRLDDVVGQLELVKEDLSARTQIRNYLQSWHPEACIHLAWYAEPGKYLNSRENINVLQASLGLLQDLFECGCEHFVGAGTCAEYETRDRLLDEKDSTKPETLYAASKLSFQLLGEQIALQYRRKFSWGRIFYLYGPFEDPRRLVASAVLKLLKGEEFQSTPGEQVRDFLHVHDVASAFKSIVEKGDSGIYNICSSVPVTIKDLLLTLGELTDSAHLISYGALHYRDWEPMFVCGNNRRLKSIGWSPDFDLHSGLKNSIDWWSAQKEHER